MSSGEAFQTVRDDWRSNGLATWLELLAVVAAIGVLLPLFDAIASRGAGRDGRYAESGFEAHGLPAAILPRVCAVLGPAAEPRVRERLCDPAQSASASQPPNAVLPLLRGALADATRAIQAPVQAAAQRIEALGRGSGKSPRSLGDTDADLREPADEIAAIEADIAPWIARYWLEPTSGETPAPLACAMAYLEAGAAIDGARSRPTGPTRNTAPDPARQAAYANATLLLAAALDGVQTSSALATEPLLPAAPAAASAVCSGDLGAALDESAALMHGARAAETGAHKNAALLALLQHAGPKWAVAMTLGYLLVLLSRSGVASPLAGVGISLAAWGCAAWLGGVAWPLAARSVPPSLGPDGSPVWPPPGFVVGFGVVAGLCIVLAASGRRRRATTGSPARRVPLAPASRLGYPGLVVATGIGTLLLLDLSARGAWSNRYLALYHQGHLWLGMLIFSMLLFLRQPLGRALAWTLALAGEAGARTARRFGAAGSALALSLLAVAAVGAFGVALANKRQLTSELGRLWLIVGAAGFFFLRGGPLAERLGTGRSSLTSFVRYVWPMFFVVGVLVAAMVATRDMGPLLIAGLASGAFLAAAVAAWWHQRSGRAWMAFGLAMVLFAAWIGATTWALFLLGSVDSVTAARLESLAAPLAAGNDQLALVGWFQRSAPADGYGLGAAPWCGLAAFGAHCSGVPVQIHSDYTFTALVGVFGSAAAWAAALGSALWLHRLVRHHGRVTRGEPRLVATHGRVAPDGQALLSWVGVAWVVLTSCQLAVTIAGNVAVLPLTGVTFPFVSYGMTSLVVNLAFLALCLQVDVAKADSHG
ncbi:MAG: FtsW/RodA/SpoVE family cell cycle protein [Rhizobacter sp.]